MSNFETLKAQHDTLLENMPEGETHNEDACPICNPVFRTQERGEMSESYSQEQLDAAVEAGKAPLLAELDTVKTELEKIKTVLSASEEDARFEAVRAEYDEKITSMKSELDNFELKASNAEQELANVLAFLEKCVADAALAQAIEARKEARIALIKEHTSFSDEKIAERIDDWASLEDDVFEERLAEWKELSTAKAEGAAAVSPETAMRNVRAVEGSDSKESFISKIRNFEAAAAERGRSLKTL